MEGDDRDIYKRIILADQGMYNSAVDALCLERLKKYARECGDDGKTAITLLDTVAELLDIGQ